MSCHFSLSWHCQKTRGWGWLAGAGVPTHPVEKDREVRRQAAVKHFSRWHHVMNLFITIYHASPCLPKHTQAGEAKSILRNWVAREKWSQGNILNQSFRQSAIHQGSVGFTLVNCSTMWFLSGELDKFNGPRQPNTLMELVKPQRKYSECLSTHALWWVVTLGWQVRAFFRPAHSCGRDDIPYISEDCTTMMVMMASSQISKPGLIGGWDIPYSPWNL